MKREDAPARISPGSGGRRPYVRVFSLRRAERPEQKDEAEP